LSSGIIIRTFSYSQDWPAVLELWQTAGPGLGLGRSDTEDEIRKKLTRDPQLFLVAEHNSRLVGAVLGGYDGRRGIVYHVAVSQPGRKDGTGAALMEELEARLRQLGCIRCYLLVKYENNDALKFYERRGWEEMHLHLLGKDL